MNYTELDHAAPLVQAFKSPHLIVEELHCYNGYFRDMRGLAMKELWSSCMIPIPKSSVIGRQTR